MALGDIARNVFHEPARRVYAFGGRLFNALLERRFGVETSRIVTLAEMGLVREHCIDYEPSSWLVLRRVLSAREVDPERDVFLDFGCGKGRVLLQAAAFPFRRIVGVDISPDLIATARANIAATLPKLCCKNIELVVADLNDYEVPDDLTVAYFYNPVSGELFAKVVSKLVASLERQPRVLRVIYNSPREEHTLLQSGARLVKVSQRMRDRTRPNLENSLRVYVFDPAQTGGACSAV